MLPRLISAITNTELRIRKIAGIKKETRFAKGLKVIIDFDSSWIKNGSILSLARVLFLHK